MNSNLATLEVGRERQGCFPYQIHSMRAAQRRWADTSIVTRIAVLTKFRQSVGKSPVDLAKMVERVRVHSSTAEILSSEILPLLDACKFAEGNAANALRPCTPKRGHRPIWLGGVDVEVRREPFGIVLIIAPGNYPLFLAGVQALQALVAGNAVLLKPAPNSSQVAHRLRELLIEAGLDPALLTLTDEDPDCAHQAIMSGVDKVVITGSEAAGRDVLKTAAQTITPVTCELSGCDAMIVLAGADLALSADALRFALKLNASQTCMKPRRIFVHDSITADFKKRALDRIRDLRIPLRFSSSLKMAKITRASREQGVDQLSGDIFPDHTVSPHLFENGDLASDLWQADLFAPLVAIRSFSSERDLIEQIDACSYALGASIFGPQSQAQRLGAQINAGFVLVNDLIVPTADPRFPFSGRKHSGFGVTRGIEGLLEFTRVKVVSVRRSGHPHFQEERPEDASLFAGFISVVHAADWPTRLRGLVSTIRAVRNRKQSKDGNS